MSKDITPSSDRSRDQAGLEFLRSIANLPRHTVEINVRRERHRDVVIHRDGFGNVIGSTERITESDAADLYGQWSD